MNTTETPAALLPAPLFRYMESAYNACNVQNPYDSSRFTIVRAASQWTWIARPS
jgi:hypothetical protein